MFDEEQHLSIEQIERLLEIRLTESENVETFAPVARRHIASCDVCRRLLLEYERSGQLLGLVASELPERGTPACPSEELLRELAAGILDPVTAEKAIAHATGCDHCGPLMRQAVKDFGDQSTVEETAQLSSLRSSTPGWQESLARRMGLFSSQARAPLSAGFARHKAVRSWVFQYLPWACAATAVLIIGLIALGWTLRRPKSSYAEDLIAQAYAERRSLEVRIPGAPYAPMSVQRSSGGSRLDRPSALLKAESLIAESLRRQPRDPDWLQAKARADLLDGSTESAISSLKTALEERADSPGLLTDLASAYFQRGEQTDRAIDYGTAVEYLGKALTKTPDDPTALFNRAVVSERLSLYGEAALDWEHYLRVDPSGAWSDEARRRLADLREKLNTKERNSATHLLNPSEICVRVSLLDQSTWVAMEPRIEEYLDLAIRDWLPAAFPAEGLTAVEYRLVDARGALLRLAAILSTKHNDDWLEQFIIAKSSGVLGQAVLALKMAVEANAEGKAPQGYAEAKRAERLYRRAGNTPGLVRSQMEEMYSLHRLFHSAECLRVGASVERSIAHLRYAWIETQLRLEQVSCLDSQAEIDEGNRIVRTGLRLAKNARYNILSLRGIALAANLETDKGNITSAAAWDRLGLKEYWTGLYPPIRAYQFYDDLTDNAQRAQWWQLASSTGRESVRQIALTRNRPGEAMAHYQLAISLGMAGNAREAAKEYASARDILSSLPSDEGRQGIEADAELQLAEAEADQGRLAEAQARLLQAKASLPDGLDSYGTWLTYYRATAEIARKRGDTEGLRRACTMAVAIGELGLDSIRSERDRFTWNRDTSSCYREMVLTKLREHDLVSALAIWEWYQGAAARPRPDTHSTFLGFADLERKTPILRAPNIQPYIQELRHETIVSYAALDGRMSAWIYDDRGVHWKDLGVEVEKLTHVSAAFATECANPESDLAALRGNGRQLYEWLVQPLTDRLDANRALVVETDGIVGALPFQALVEPDGEYFGSRRSVMFSPGLVYIQRLRPSNGISPRSAALVVGNPARRDADHAGSSLPDADREAEQVSEFFGHSVLLRGKQATANAILSHLSGKVVFHFAGHALSSPVGTGLEVAPDMESEGLPGTLLSPQEIAGRRFRDLRLVILSACSTAQAGQDGFGDPDNIAAAFLRAGVPLVVASRWNVDSSATADLMKLAYDALLRGESIGDSLRWAASRMRGTANRDHPYYWAAFSAFGRA